MTMTFEQRRNRVDSAYSGIPTFLRAPICTELDKLDADIAIMGVPTDDGSPFMAGSRFGPRRNREGQWAAEQKGPRALRPLAHAKRSLASAKSEPTTPTAMPAAKS